MPDIDWSKPVEVVLSSIDRVRPVVASFPMRYGERLVVYEIGGSHESTTTMNEHATFRNVRRKVKHELWINLYKSGFFTTHNSPGSADSFANNCGRCRVDCRHIEWEADADE